MSHNTARIQAPLPPKEAKNLSNRYSGNGRSVRPRDPIPQNTDKGDDVIMDNSLATQDDRRKVPKMLPVVVVNGNEASENKASSTTRKKKPLFMRMMEEGLRQKQREENERNEIRIRRKLELKKANFSLAAIREHIAKHDEIMAVKQREYEKNSPVRRAAPYHSRAGDSSVTSLHVPDTLQDSNADDSSVEGLPAVGKVLDVVNDESSIGSKESLGILKGAKRKRKRLKTKLNEKIKNDLQLEKALRDSAKKDVEERLKKKEEFSEHVKKHKRPSPQKVMLPAGISADRQHSKQLDPLVRSSPTHSSSITALRIIDNLDSLIVSQLQATPRGAPSPSPLNKLSPRGSLGDIRSSRDMGSRNDFPKVSPRLSLPNEANIVHESDGVNFHQQNPTFGRTAKQQKDFPVVSQLIEKYEYPAEVRHHCSPRPVGSESLPNLLITNEQLDALDSRSINRAQWVMDLLTTDAEEDNLAEIYEAGFSMYLAEKGITLAL